MWDHYDCLRYCSAVYYGVLFNHIRAQAKQNIIHRFIYAFWKEYLREIAIVQPCVTNITIFFHNKGSQISLNFNHKKSNKLILLGHQTFWTLGICLWNDAWTTSYENRLVFHLTLNWQSYFIHLPCKKILRLDSFYSNISCSC